MILFQSILACVMVPGLFSEHGGDAASISHRLSPVPAATPSAAGSGQELRGPNLSGCDRLSSHVPAMDAENGAEGLASGRHAHESQPAEFVAMKASHNIRRLNPAKWLKDLPEIASRDIFRQVAHTDIHSVPLSSASTTCASKACLTKTKDSGDGS